MSSFWVYDVTVENSMRMLHSFDERAGGVEMVGNENEGGAGFGGHAHVHEPHFAVARVHLPSRMSSFSCSTSREGTQPVAQVEQFGWA